MRFDEIPDDWKRQAVEEKGWPENVVLDIWANFRDYWQNGKGKSTKRIDWAASWRTWFRKETIKVSPSQNVSAPLDEKTRIQNQVSALRIREKTGIYISVAEQRFLELNG